MKCCKTDMVKDGDGRLKCPHCGVRPRISGLRSKYAAALEAAAGNDKKAAKQLGTALSDFLENKNELGVDVFHRAIAKVRRYVVTTAQNETPTHSQFFKTLLRYCSEHSAELIIIPVRYKNPTSVFDTATDAWAPELRPYLCDSRVQIHNHLFVMGDVKTIPTAMDPLSGYDELSGRYSAIYGHTSLMFKTVPVAIGEMPKIICTTGAVTVPNCTDSKQGKRGEFHHVLSAQVVELDGDIFHIRQLVACKNGTFIDLDREYTPTGSHKAGPCGLVLGDWHDFARCPSVEKATFTDKKSLVKLIKPEIIVWPDALDFYSRNHHHQKKPFINIAKHHAGVHNVEQEVARCFTRIERLTGNSLAVFPFSNHPAALTRWIEETDWREDPENARFYLKTALAMVESTVMKGHKTSTIDAFAYWGNIYYPEAVYLGPNDPYEYHGIRVDMHGHIGLNGARGGSVKTFSRLGVRSVTQHGHGPGIFHGAYRVGTSSVYDQEYVAGPSSWLNTHCIIYANGKRSLINIIKGKFKK
jgi:hypothetical protein